MHVGVVSEGYHILSTGAWCTNACCCTPPRAASTSTASPQPLQAPEQFRGQAQPASDLYGLGGVLLYLLSGTPPSDFPQSGLRIDFEDAVPMTGRMRRVRLGGGD